MKRVTFESLDSYVPTAPTAASATPVVNPVSDPVTVVSESKTSPLYRISSYCVKCKYIIQSSSILALWWAVWSLADAYLLKYTPWPEIATIVTITWLYGILACMPQEM